MEDLKVSGLELTEHFSLVFRGKIGRNNEMKVEGIAKKINSKKNLKRENIWLMGFVCLDIKWVLV